MLPPVLPRATAQRAPNNPKLRVVLVTAVLGVGTNGGPSRKFRLNSMVNGQMT